MIERLRLRKMDTAVTHWATAVFNTNSDSYHWGG